MVPHWNPKFEKNVQGPFELRICLTRHGSTNIEARNLYSHSPLNVFLSGRWYQKEKDVVPVEETVVEGEKGSWTKSGASCCKESASTTHRQTPCQNLAKVFAGVALGWNLTQRSVNCAEVAAQKDQHVPGVDFGGDYEQLGRGE